MPKYNTAKNLRGGGLGALGFWGGGTVLDDRGLFVFFRKNKA